MRSLSFREPIGLTLCLAALLGLALCQAPRPAAAQSLPFNITFDYSQTSSDLFTDTVKAQLDESARFIGSYITDTNTLRVTVVTDDGLEALASSAPSKWTVNTSTRFLPTEGGITFRTDVITDARDNSSSIVALTAHELMHILGFISTAQPFAQYSKTGKFTGPATLRMNNGQAPAVSGGHFVTGVKDVFGIKPRMLVGGGDLLSVLDLAVLTDLGYNVPVIKNAATPPTLGFTIRPANYVKLTFEDADGNPVANKLQQGYGGADILIAGDGDYLQAGAGGDDILVSGPGTTEMRGDNSPAASYGKDGKDTFVVRANSGSVKIDDLDVGLDVILIAPEYGLSASDIDKLPSRLQKAEVAPGSGFYFVGTWVLKLGNLTLTIATKDKTLPTAANFQIGTYQLPP